MIKIIAVHQMVQVTKEIKDCILISWVVLEIHSVHQEVQKIARNLLKIAKVMIPCLMDLIEVDPINTTQITLEGGILKIPGFVGFGNPERIPNLEDNFYLKKRTLTSTCLILKFIKINKLPKFNFEKK